MTEPIPFMTTAEAVMQARGLLEMFHADRIPDIPVSIGEVAGDPERLGHLVVALLMMTDRAVDYITRAEGVTHSDAVSELGNLVLLALRRIQGDPPRQP